MSDTPLRLHIGGVTPKPGWKILNIQPDPNVDFIGNCTDLSQFTTCSVHEIYASHVLEHLSYQGELTKALQEMHRVLVPGGVLYISVPDFEQLCRMFLDPSLAFERRFHIMRMAFGGQMDPHDFHKLGLTWEFLCYFLGSVGFKQVGRVPTFDLFENDCSSLRFNGQLISLNVVTFKDGAAPVVPIDFP